MAGRLPDTDQIGSRLSLHGLSYRGGFNFEAEERAGLVARSVVLAGNLGDSFWPVFQRWLESQSPPPANPLDTWSREVIDRVASEFGARAVYPSDQPFYPFQQWAMRAEGLKLSPLGILIHPEYGLWHAYRGALLFDAPGDFAPSQAIHPCDACTERPCLSACPVSAHSPGGFDYPACIAHVRGVAAKGKPSSGCNARNACPIAQVHRYGSEMQRFLMRAFERL